MISIIPRFWLVLLCPRLSRLFMSLYLLVVPTCHHVIPHYTFDSILDSYGTAHSNLTVSVSECIVDFPSNLCDLNSLLAPLLINSQSCLALALALAFASFVIVIRIIQTH